MILEFTEEEAIRGAKQIDVNGPDISTIFKIFKIFGPKRITLPPTTPADSASEKEKQRTSV